MTVCQYLEDTYQFDGTGKVMSVFQAEGGVRVELDRTVFYPQGGGQPSDIGFIVSTSHRYEVVAVSFDAGKVFHEIRAAKEEDFPVGSVVEMRVDGDSRLVNARNHSGGHLISHVVETAISSVDPVKGYHFSDGAYVEFLDPEKRLSAEKMHELNQEIFAVVERNLAISARMASVEEVERARPELARMIPAGKPVRMVKFGSYNPLPCGGTHVRTTGELRGLEISRIKRKKDRVKVSYTL